MLLKWIPDKQSVGLWIVFIWRRIWLRHVKG